MRDAAVPLMLAAIAGSSQAQADVYPPAPQPTPHAQNGVDNWGLVRVPAGNAGFVDPSGYGYCRYVKNGNGLEVTLGIATPIEWQYFRAGKVTNTLPPGIAADTCCRPATPTPADFCMYGGAPSDFSPPLMPYTVRNSELQVSAVCHQLCLAADGTQFDCSYIDVVTYQCGQVGSGAMADGQWNDVSQGASCAPNAYTTNSACDGSQYIRTTYNSCGQVQSQLTMGCTIDPGGSNGGEQEGAGGAAGGGGW